MFSFSSPRPMSFLPPFVQQESSCFSHGSYFIYSVILLFCFFKTSFESQGGCPSNSSNESFQELVECNLIFEEMFEENIGNQKKKILLFTQPQESVNGVLTHSLSLLIQPSGVWPKCLLHGSFSSSPSKISETFKFVPLILQRKKIATA